MSLACEFVCAPIATRIALAGLLDPPQKEVSLPRARWRFDHDQPHIGDDRGSNALSTAAIHPSRSASDSSVSSSAASNVVTSDPLQPPPRLRPRSARALMREPGPRAVG